MSEGLAGLLQGLNQGLQGLPQNVLQRDAQTMQAEQFNLAQELQRTLAEQSHGLQSRELDLRAKENEQKLALDERRLALESEDRGLDRELKTLQRDDLVATRELRRRGQAADVDKAEAEASVAKHNASPKSLLRRDQIEDAQVRAAEIAAEREKLALARERLTDPAEIADFERQERALKIKALDNQLDQQEQLFPEQVANLKAQTKQTEEQIARSQRWQQEMAYNAATELQSFATKRALEDNSELQKMLSMNKLQTVLQIMKLGVSSCSPCSA